MRTTTRTALAGVPLSLALLLAGACSDDEGDDGAATTTTTEATTTTAETTSAPAEPETTAPPSSPTTQTTAPPATATTAPSATETTAPPGDGTEGEFGRSDAAQLIRAWGAGDRERALELATPEVVNQLFGTFTPGGTDWELTSCDGAAGSFYCTFASASKGMTVTVRRGNIPDENGDLPLISGVEISG